MCSLNAEDVPGAKLSEFLTINQHSVTQLKRWLDCRGILSSGKKTELIKRYVTEDYTVENE